MSFGKQIILLPGFEIQIQNPIGKFKNGFVVIFI
jgi:hypothetical protein